MIHVFAPMPPRIPFEALSPEGLWLSAVVAALVLFGFAAAALTIYRRTERSVGLFDAVRPVPQRSEYDRSLTSQQRLEELHWLEGLMATPSYGEGSEGQSSRG